MEDTLATQEIDISGIILDTINSLCQTLFSSIDNKIFSLLDEIIFISPTITETNYLEQIMGHNANAGLLILANSLLVAFVLYYAIRRFTAFFNGQEVESPSNFICGLGFNIFKKTISFSSLINELNGNSSNNFNIFSIDGLLTGMLSISSISLIITFTFRYILAKILILLSPFAFLSLLLIQIVVALILLLPFAIFKENSNDIFNKFLLIGSIYALLKSNNIVKEFINGTGISTDFSSGLNGLRSIFTK